MKAGDECSNRIALERRDVAKISRLEQSEIALLGLFARAGRAVPRMASSEEPVSMPARVSMISLFLCSSLGVFHFVAS